MFEWLINVTPWWWYVGLAVFLLATASGIGVLSSCGMYIVMSIMLVFLYYFFGFIWMFTLGLFFNSPWDMPWWLWVILILAGLGSGGPAATYLVTIKKL